jgi:hypothetical protein
MTLDLTSTAEAEEHYVRMGGTDVIIPATAKAALAGDPDESRPFPKTAG